MRISLFWRTFLLIAALVACSLGAMLGLLRFLDRAPPEQRLAWEIASVVNLTRSALVSSQPERRMLLLRELARDEGVRVVPLEPDDRIRPAADVPQMESLRQYLRGLLGPETVAVLGRVNDQDGLWISFDIEGDGYWLLMHRRRIDRHFGPGLGSILAIAAALSLVGALVLSRLVNEPLARLAAALSALSRGRSPPRLREDLATEIAEVNRSFNAMAADLSALDADRSIALAGISHDIRAPLARLRMEVEMASIDEATRAPMVEDIERIDRIVGQFVEFARAGAGLKAESVEVAALIAGLSGAYRAATLTGELVLDTSCADDVRWVGDPTDLRRALSNLLDNALRYGRSAEDGVARVRLTARRAGGGIEVSVVDHGPGVPPESLEHLLRPFTRLDSARGEREGAGLGLAIVERMARRYHGRLRIENVVPTGFSATLVLADARRSARPDDPLVQGGASELP